MYMYVYIDIHTCVRVCRGMEKKEISLENKKAMLGYTPCFGKPLEMCPSQGDMTTK